MLTREREQLLAELSVLIQQAMKQGEQDFTNDLDKVLFNTSNRWRLDNKKQK